MVAPTQQNPTPPGEPAELLRLNEAAALLGLSRSGFYEHIGVLTAHGMREVRIACGRPNARPLRRFTRKSILRLIERAAERGQVLS